MRRRGRIALLLLIGLAAYAVFLTANMPAAVAWQWAGPAVAPQVQAYGLDGTLWEGRAETVIQGPRRFDQVRWRFLPARLLRGQLGFTVAGGLPDGRIQGTLALGPDGTLRWNDVKADMEVDTLLALAGRPGFGAAAEGHFQALLPSLTMTGDRLRAAEGMLDWNGARVGFGRSVPLGDIGLRLEPAGDSGTKGTLVNQDGAFELGGDLSLDREGAYRVEMRITPRDPDDTATRQAAQVLGLANPRGTTVVEISGRLNGGPPTIRQRSG